MTAIHQGPTRFSTVLTRRAWLSLLGFVPAFGLAFLVGEGLASAMGHPSGGAEQAPLWVMLAAGVPAVLVFALPAVATVFFGRQAVRLGDRHARVPIVVSLVVAGGFALTNVLAPLLGG